MFNVLFLEPKLGPDEILRSIDAHLTVMLIDGGRSKPSHKYCEVPEDVYRVITTFYESLSISQHILAKKYDEFNSLCNFNTCTK